MLIWKVTNRRLRHVGNNREREISRLDSAISKKINLLFSLFGGFKDDFNGLIASLSWWRGVFSSASAASTASSADFFTLEHCSQRRQEPLQFFVAHMGRHVVQVQRPRQNTKIYIKRAGDVSWWIVWGRNVNSVYLKINIYLCIHESV